MTGSKDFSYYEEEYAYKLYERGDDYEDYDDNLDEEGEKRLFEILEKKYAKKPDDGKPRVRL